MDKETTSTVPSKAEGALADQLGALIYYDRGAKKAGDPAKPVQFEDLSEEEQKPFVAEAIRFIIRLDKMNKMIVRKVSIKDQEARDQKSLDTLTEIIRGFVNNLNTVRPAFFPCEELAHRILDGGKKL